MRPNGMYRRLIYPFLKQVDAETVHDSTIRLLELAQGRTVGRALIRILAGKVPNHRVSLWGLNFPNQLGIAAGFDKDVRVVRALSLLGFGHIEVGTLTPHPQVGNPKPRVFRLPEDRAIINRMGFPNRGVADAVKRLGLAKSTELNCVLGVSLGKQKETPIEEAASDYMEVMTGVYPFADYLAINVSSPNTPNLRDLQGKRHLDTLLEELMNHNVVLANQFDTPEKPLLIKIAPDLTMAEIDTALESALDHGIKGILATNTTLARGGLSSHHYRETGGLSGLPVAQKSNEIIAYISRRTQGQLPIIGVGGVFTVEDVRQKLAAGASLVQVYTGMVYEGPGLAGRLNRAM
jgi:dihydroorotate dehydrogenase